MGIAVGIEVGTLDGIRVGRLVRSIPGGIGDKVDGIEVDGMAVGWEIG